MSKRESFGLFSTEQELIGWLLMLSPVPVCGGDKMQQSKQLQTCCQLHAVQDCLKHAGEDDMSAVDCVTCIKAVEFLREGRGVAANGSTTLPPNYAAVDNEVEN